MRVYLFPLFAVRGRPCSNFLASTEGYSLDFKIQSSQSDGLYTVAVRCILVEAIILSTLQVQVEWPF